MTMNENERERWRARTVMEMDVVSSLIVTKFAGAKRQDWTKRFYLSPSLSLYRFICQTPALL